MSNYVQSTNFATKDALPSGDPLKIVKGTEINTEFANIAIAVATKADLVSPTFTGTPLAPTASTTTNNTQVATTAFVQQEISAHTVSTAQIENSAVTTAKIADANVTTAKIADANVTTAKIADANVTTAKIADANVTTAKIADANVTPAKLSQPLTLGSVQATTSGTNIDFTNIPSWVKRITLMFDGVSSNGTSPYQVQIGAGAIITSEYVGKNLEITTSSGTGATTYSSGYIVARTVSASMTIYGELRLNLISGNKWLASGVALSTTTDNQFYFSGVLNLGGTLDRLRITTVNGTDTFDAGSVNILYE